MNDQITSILVKFGSKLAEILSHSYGRIMTCVTFGLSFLAPVKYAFAAMGFAILMDLLFRIVSLIKRKQFILSEKARDTVAKIMVYFCCMIVVYVTEHIFSDESFIMTRLGCTLACACEIWSMLGSAMIICPTLVFPKLLKMQLTGEIESKLGKEISNTLNNQNSNQDGKEDNTPRDPE